MRVAMVWSCALALAAGLVPGAWGQCNQNCEERRTISVNGTATVTAEADLALVRVGYKIYGQDAMKAYASAVETSNAIMAALTESGIAKGAIESTSQVLQHTQLFELQQYPYNSGERAQREFTVVQSWTIRVKPDQAGKALNTAITAGANESGWVEWVAENPEGPQAEAVAKAVADARKEAERIAQISGVRLGRVVSVTQNQGPMAMDRISGGFVMGALGGPQGMNQQLAINSRRIEYQSTVYVVFSIE
jgi:uncharacterized protein YggE